MSSKAVPPPLPAPKRQLSAPARRESGTFTLESDTPPRAQAVAEFAAVISVFDELTSPERAELTELLFVWKSMSPEARERVLEAALAEVFP